MITPLVFCIKYTHIIAEQLIKSLPSIVGNPRLITHRYSPLIAYENCCFGFVPWLIYMYIFNMRGPVLELTILTRRVPLVKLELPTLPEHMNSPPCFSGVRVTWSLVSCLCFVDRCLSFFTFSFGHCVVCSSIYTNSDYPFKWYLQTLLVYSRLIKYKQHTAGFTENNIGPRTSQGRTLLLNI